MMKTNNNSFSFRRVGLLMKRDVVEKWKTGIMLLLVLYASLLFAMINSWLKAEETLRFSFEDTETVFETHIGRITLTTFILLMCLSVGFASRVMDVKATRQDAISYLMVPATITEKFLVRSLLVIIVPLVVVFGGLCMADLTRYLCISWFDLPEIFSQPILWEVLDELNFFASPEDVTYTNFWPKETTYSVMLAQADVMLWLCWWHSAFLFGGCRWSKHPFWKTLGVMLPLNIIVITIYSKVAQWLYHNDWEIYHRMCDQWGWLSTITPNSLLYCGFGLGIILIVLNWYGAYRLFCRSQVVEPKRFSR